MEQHLRSKQEQEKQVVRFNDSALLQRCTWNVESRKSSLSIVSSFVRDYAWQRVDQCPLKEKKTFCSNCKIHCYEPRCRAEIIQVMRYAGPRMMLYHPWLAIRHLWYSKILKQ
jgi:hypothetical protein